MKVARAIAAAVALLGTAAARGTAPRDPPAPAPARLDAPAPLAPAPPAAAPLPPRRRVLLLLRAVLYDRNLAARLGGHADVVVLFRPGDRASEADRDAMLDAVDAAAREVVAAGRPVRALAVPWTGPEALERRLTGARPAVLYACAGLEAEAAPVAGVTRATGVLSASGSRDMAVAGIALALVHRGARAGIVVNLEAARAEGADLDAALLGLAEVIGRPELAR